MGKEVDVLIPKHKIAIEYQGRIHFDDYLKTGKLKERQENDQVKKQTLEEKGYYYIAIDDIDGKLSLREIEILLDKAIKNILSEYEPPQRKIVSARN